MKKLYVLVLPLLLSGLLVSCGGGDDTPKGTYELSYTLNEDGLSYAVTGISYSNSKATYDVVIPEKYENLPVTTIGKKDATAGSNNNVFASDKNLKSLKMSNSIKEIAGGGLFYKCEKLEKVEFSSSIEEIDAKQVIFRCPAIKEIELPDSIGKISEDFMNNNDALTKIKLPKNLTSIPHNAFRDNASLKEVIWPEEVFTVSWTSFVKCGFTEIVMPDNMFFPYGTGARAFASNDNLTKVTCGRGMQNCPGLFANCPNLTEFNIKQETVSIYYNGTGEDGAAFSGCTSLHEINYESTKADFEKIKLDTDFYKRGCNIEVVHCSDGDITYTA